MPWGPCTSTLKIAGALGYWWQATNGTLQGCPVSMILVNVFTTIWKWQVDSLRRQPCARTAALPPVLDEEAAADLEAGAPLPLTDWLRRARIVGLCGRHRGSSPRGGVPSGDGPHDGGVATGHGLGRARGQVLLLGAGGAKRPGTSAPGRSNPASDLPTCQLGVDVAIGGSRTTGPVLSQCLEAGRGALRCLPHLSTYDCRE